MEKKRNPLPENAKLVFKGQIFEVWQWEQKLYDGSTGIFERVKRPSTAQVIATAGDKILVQKQEQPDKIRPYYSLPGGRCDDEPNEDPLLAAKRELLEEAGYVSADWSLWREESPLNKVIWTIYTFLARECRKEKEPRLDPGEKIENIWVSFDEFLNLAEEMLFYDRESLKMLSQMKADPKVKEDFRKLIFG
ncbi:MAG: NUDIX hydrolase [Candidatus Liptonbacteria bacterium]|nr:NUDIX hydrolase [Candidatus Liptonbacteria bacterium]